MPSENYNLIRDAILNKQQVVAIYNGHLREMCPHAIGLKNGKEQAIFYQFGGTSSSGGSMSSGSTENWRCIAIEGLTDVVLQDGEWHSYSPHTRPQTCVGDIDVEVEG